MLELETASGIKVCPIGLGTFPFQGKTMAEMIVNAHEEGYQLIDTADDYRGESGIGMAIKELGVNRHDLFIQTKVSNDTAYNDEPNAGKFFNSYSPFMKRHTVSDIVEEKVYNSLREMKTDYLDSVLIHYPYPYYYEQIWQSLMDLKDKGYIRYIGVSNFHPEHLEPLLKLGAIPSFNEIYLSPLATKERDLDYCKEHNIQVITYSPLKDVVNGHLSNSCLNDIAQKYNKSLSQIVLRWNLDRGCYVLPKTKSKSRLKENKNILDFSLLPAEIDQINRLNINKQFLIESKICPGL